MNYATIAGSLFPSPVLSVETEGLDESLGKHLRESGDELAAIVRLEDGTSVAFGRAHYTLIGGELGKVLRTIDALADVVAEGFGHGDRVQIHYKQANLSPIQRAFQDKVGYISGEEKDGRTRLYRVKFSPAITVPGMSDPVTSDLWSAEFLRKPKTSESIDEADDSDGPAASVSDILPAMKANIRAHIAHGRTAYRFGRFKPGMRVKWQGESWLVYDANARGGSKFTLMLVSPDYARMATEVWPTQLGEGSEQEADESWSDGTPDGPIVEAKDPTLWMMFLQLEKNVLKKIEKLPNSAPVVTQVVTSLAAVRAAIKGKEQQTGKDAARLFFSATNGHFLASMPPLSRLAKQYGFDVDPYTGRVQVESVDVEDAPIVEAELFTKDTVQALVDAIEKLPVPYVSAYVSNLGGGSPTVMVRMSFDPEESWANGIMQNSRMANFSIKADGVIEQFTRSHKLPLKFRKATAKSIDDVVAKLKTYVTKVLSESETDSHWFFAESQGLQLSESVTFTDRYDALGIPRPDPKTMCKGPCEGTGIVPVCYADPKPGQLTLVRVRDESDPEEVELRRRWRVAEQENPADDGWHFVTCPVCEGSRLANESVDEGVWRTTKSGHRIYIEKGRITKGNPHVVKAARKESIDEGRGAPSWRTLADELLELAAEVDKESEVSLEVWRGNWNLQLGPGTPQAGRKSAWATGTVDPGMTPEDARDAARDMLDQIKGDRQHDESVGESKKSDIESAWRKQGVTKVRPIDRDEYPPIKGMEGPFQTRRGHIVYYDPREGRYYDSKSDIYLDHNPMESVDEAKAPKDPATMTAGEVNKEMDALSKKSSAFTDAFIADGRGHWLHSDFVKAAREGDKKAQDYIAVTNRYRDLSIEIELRYGPGAPSRMPKGFKPRKKADEAMDDPFAAPLRRAAGGVVVNSAGRILLRRPAGDFDGYVWTFPKGRVDAGESVRDAAIREVAEETGFECRIVRKIGDYRGGTSITTMFLMEPVRKVREHDEETQAIAWVHPQAAMSRIEKTVNLKGRARDMQILSDAVGSSDVPNIPSRLKGLLSKLRDYFGGGDVDEGDAGKPITVDPAAPKPINQMSNDTIWKVFRRGIVQTVFRKHGVTKAVVARTTKPISWPGVEGQPTWAKGSTIIVGYHPTLGPGVIVGRSMHPSLKASSFQGIQHYEFDVVKPYDIENPSKSESIGEGAVADQWAGWKGWTPEERIVFSATVSLKPSYGGDKDFRFKEAARRTGLTREAWDTAVASLKRRGAFNAAGAVNAKVKKDFYDNRKGMHPSISQGTGTSIDAWEAEAGGADGARSGAAKLVGGQRAVPLSALKVGAKFHFPKSSEVRTKTSNAGSYTTSDGRKFQTGKHTAVIPVNEAALPKSPLVGKTIDQAKQGHAGDYVLVIWRMQKSKWGWSLNNPQGGGFATTTEVGSVPRVITSVLSRMNLPVDRVFVIVGQRNGDPQVVASTFWVDASGNMVESIDESVASKKLAAMRAGKVVAVSDDLLSEIEDMVKSDEDLRSMPNPKRVGTKDVYVAWIGAPKSKAPMADESIDEAKKVPDINSEVYRGQAKLPKYNGTTSPLSASTSDAGKLLAQRLPDWTKEDHLAAAATHDAAKAKAKADWSKLADTAAQAAWGRKFQATDYRISGVASDEFSKVHQDALRDLAHRQDAHGSAANAHRSAAKKRSLAKESVDESVSDAVSLFEMARLSAGGRNALLRATKTEKVDGDEAIAERTTTLSWMDDGNVLKKLDVRWAEDSPGSKYGSKTHTYGWKQHSKIASSLLANHEALATALTKQRDKLLAAGWEIEVFNVRQNEAVASV